MKALRSLRLLVLMVGLTVAVSAVEAGDGGKKGGTTMFQDPPNPAEILEALGEKPKIKYRGPKTRAIVIEGESAAAAAPPAMPPDVPDYNSAPAAPEPMAASAPPPRQEMAAPEPMEESRPAPARKSAKKSATYAKQPKVAFPLTFEVNSANLSPQAMSYVDSMAAALQQKPDMALYISGHTDASGSDEINMPLSLRRAEAVKQYLQDRHNIDPSRMSVAGMGSSELLIRTNPRAEENRRVEFVKNNN
ncbi:MAG: OmpA family protein [Magnetococcales bacterium]|nr:OmpA family protein [Magnetococcales bacterium]